MAARTVIAVALAADGEDAAGFRAALAGSADVDLRFAAREAFAPLLAEAEIVVADRLSAAELAAAPRLRWLASWSAGLDRTALPELLARGIALTGASGVHGPNIAEHVLGLMIAFARRFPDCWRAQRERRWAKDALAGSLDELHGRTLAIVGYGEIGRALALRARPFGLRVIAVKRDPRAGAAGEVDALLGVERLDEALAQAHHVCIALPLTAATRGLFDAARLARMRRDALLINVGRGGIVDEAALAAAVRDGRLRGAALDVFADEPLPSGSPLWELEQVLITPHLAGSTPRYFARAAELFARNLARWRAGQPLAHRYEADRGY